MIGKCNIGGGKSSGLYVWKKLSSQGGIFIEYIVSDNPNKYPNDSEQGGYYYEMVEDVTPEVTAQTPVITQILEGLVGKAQGANATADKILKGYSAYVGQELVEGTAKDVDVAVPALFGYTKMAVDEFKFASTTEARTITLTHSLGEKPKLFMVTTDRTSDLPVSSFRFIIGDTLDWATFISVGFYKERNKYSDITAPGAVTATETTVNFNLYNDFGAGVNYKLISMA